MKKKTETTDLFDVVQIQNKFRFVQDVIQSECRDRVGFGSHRALSL